MKTIKKIIIATAIIIAGLLVITFTSCEDNNEDFGTMTVMMTDAPADYSAVNVEIEAVMVKHEDERIGDNGWIALSTKAGVYNLLSLQNGITTDIAHASIEEGAIEKIRIAVGNENSIVIDGADINLNLAPEFSGGVDIDVNGVVSDNEDLIVTIDFDAQKSITSFDGTRFLLEPHITVRSVVYTD